MATEIRVGEAGVRHLMAMSFDMSSNTSLALVYTKADQTTLSVTPTLGGTSQSINSLTVAANEWVYYDFVPGDIASGEDGTWTAEFIYTNTGPTPDDIYKNRIPITFVVSP